MHLRIQASAKGEARDCIFQLAKSELYGLRSNSIHNCSASNNKGTFWRQVSIACNLPMYFCGISHSRIWLPLGGHRVTTLLLKLSGLPWVIDSLSRRSEQPKVFVSHVKSTRDVAPKWQVGSTYIYLESCLVVVYGGIASTDNLTHATVCEHGIYHTGV